MTTLKEKLPFSDKPWLEIVVDIAAAASASVMVSPFITIVDRSIIENASGVRRLKDGLRDGFREFTTRPLTFFRRREFALIFGVYHVTYVSANTIDTACEQLSADNMLPKFLGTSVVNMTACIAKDREFTRMFGKVSPKPVPLITYGLFASRDLLTIGASFNAPVMLSAKMQQDGGFSRKASDVTAQLLCPALVQFISTPLHLAGLDLYNNPDRSSAARTSFIRKEYFKSALARIGRIGPAFGIGGVGNKYFRERYRAFFGIQTPPPHTTKELAAESSIKDWD